MARANLTIFFYVCQEEDKKFFCEGATLILVQCSETTVKLIPMPPISLSNKNRLDDYGFLGQ